MTDQITNEKPASAPAPDARPESRQGLLLPIAIPIGAFLIIALVLFGFSRVLLSVSAHAATAVALTVAISIMAAATIVASRKRLSNGALFSMVGAVAGVAMLAGGIAIVAIGTGEKAGGGPQVVALAAPKGAAATGFEPTTLSVAANQPIELDFNNQDPGIQHNVVIFDADPAKNPDAQPLFSGSLDHRPQPDHVRRPIPARRNVLLPLRRAPDDHDRNDRVHGRRRRRRRPHRHRQVAGVRHEGDRPSGRAGDDASRSTTRTPASRTTSPSTPTPPCRRHCSRASSSRGSTAGSTQIPALDPGTYYFHCDVHPTMNGTLVVGAAGGVSGPAGATSSGATGPSPSG